LPTPGDHFELFLSGNRVEEVATLDEVLAAENSRQNAVRRLMLTSSVSVPGEVRPKHEVQVDFDPRSERRSSSGSPSTQPKITVTIRSDASGWASRTLSAVEEQIERTRLQDIGQRGALVAILLMLLLLLIALVGPSVQLTPSTTDILRRMWLTDADLDHVEKLLAPGKALTDEELRDVMTRQLRNMYHDQRPVPRADPRTWTTTDLFLLVVGNVPAPVELTA
jgi:hypothetical protein